MQIFKPKAYIQSLEGGRLYALAAFSASLFLLPLKTDKVIMKSFSRGLNIQTAKTEPPRIAFNEVRNYLEAISKKAKQPNHQRTLLDERAGINLNEKVEQKFVERTVTLIRAQKIDLKPMTISRAESLNEIQQSLSTVDRNIASRAVNDPSIVAPSSGQQGLSWVDELSSAQRNRLMTAQEKSAVLDQDWAPKTWRDVIAEQLSESPQGAPSSLPTASANQPPGASPQSLITAKKYVTGEVLLQPGLGLTDGYIDVRYVRGGVAQNNGKMSLPSNKYKIEVPEPTGNIVATLYSGKGQRLGEGRVRVAQIESAKPETSRITISPIQNSIAWTDHDFGRTMSLMSKNDYGDRGIKSENYIPSLDIEVASDDQGVSKVDNIVQDSWALVRTEAEGYMPSLDLLAAGPEKKRIVFRQKFIEALFSIAKEQQKKSEFAETKSVVWGQAIMDGKPQAGVTMSVEFAEQFRPVYFNQFMIPDPSLKATSDNGYYAILHLPEGFHSLVATRGDQYFSHVNAQAEPETVFVANLENTLAIEKTAVRVFDAFSGVPGHAELEMQSLVEPLRVDGFADIYLHDIERLSLMKVIPADVRYVSQMQIYSDSTGGSSGEIRAALIEAAWLQRLQTQNRITMSPETSTIVGFVADENYEAYLPHEKAYSSQNIVYFDPAGKIANSGVAGGGFIMFNVPPGTHSVVTVAKSNNAVHSQVVPVDAGMPVALYFHF